MATATIPTFPVAMTNGDDTRIVDNAGAYFQLVWEGYKPTTVTFPENRARTDASLADLDAFGVEIGHNFVGRYAAGRRYYMGDVVVTPQGTLAEAMQEFVSGSEFVSGFWQPMYGDSDAAAARANEAAAAAEAIIAQAVKAPSLDVRDFGVKGDGTDERAKMQTALDAAIAQGKALLVPSHMRITCGGALLLDSNLKLQLDGWLLRGFAGLTGTSGFLMNRDATVKINDVTIWGVGGLDLVDYGQTGNMIFLNGDRITVKGIMVKRFASARAWNLMGDDMLLMDCSCYGPLGGAGNGGFRYYRGRGFRGIGLHGTSGDDLFQLVPVGAPTSYAFNEGIEDAWFIGCYGRSTTARLLVAGLVMGGDTNTADGVVGMTSSVNNSGFIGCSGYGGGGGGIVIKNTNSSGTMNNILVEACSVDMVDSLTVVSSGDVYIYSMDQATGIGPMRNPVLRNVVVKNPTNVAFRVQNNNVFGARLENCQAQRSTRTPTAYVIELCGVDTAVVGGSFDGKDGAATVMRLAATGGQNTPQRPTINGATIKGIGDNQTGIAIAGTATVPIASPTLKAVRFESSFATAKAFTTTNTVSDLAYTELDFTGIPGTGTKFTNAATGNTMTGVNNRGLILPSSPDWMRPNSALGQSLPRSVNMVNTLAPMVSGQLLLVGIPLSAGQVVTNLTAYLGGTTFAGVTNQWFGLWTSSRSLLGVTADAGSASWVANLGKTLALTTPYTVPTSGMYYMGICIVATTMPTMMGTPSFTSFMNQAPVICGNSTAGLTGPSSAPASAATPVAFPGIVAVQAS